MWKANQINGLGSVSGSGGRVELRDKLLSYDGPTGGQLKSIILDASDHARIQVAWVGLRGQPLPVLPTLPFRLSEYVPPPGAMSEPNGLIVLLPEGGPVGVVPGDEIVVFLDIDPGPECIITGGAILDIRGVADAEAAGPLWNTPVHVEPDGTLSVDKAAVEALRAGLKPRLTADLHEAAVKEGIVQADMPISMGSMHVPPGGTATLDHYVEQAGWLRGIFLVGDPACPERLRLDSVTCGGLPVSDGKPGTFLSGRESRRPWQHFVGIATPTRRMVMTGQSVRITITNMDEREDVDVFGILLCDVLSPYYFHEWIQRSLLRAIQTAPEDKT
jgi:hypothetical protein